MGFGWVRLKAIAVTQRVMNLHYREVLWRSAGEILEVVFKYRQPIQIVVECILFACLLGIALDLITANVAVEYFTVHHPHVVDSKSPWVMALVWGSGASWWFGAIAGVVLAALILRRSQPILTSMIRGWMFWTCVILWLVMIGILAVSYVGIGFLPIEPKDAKFESNRRMMSVAFAHMTEYVLGVIALIIVGRKVVRQER
jgi:hypothetical protein